MFEWLKESLELYGASILAFVVVGFAIGLLTETFKRIVFKALDAKYSENAVVATIKTVSTIAFAVFAIRIIFTPVFDTMSFIGGEGAKVAWYVLMFFFQMYADMQAVKKVWNWILVKADAPKKEAGPKMKKVVRYEKIDGTDKVRKIVDYVVEE